MPNMFGGDQYDPEYGGAPRGYYEDMAKRINGICNSAGIPDDLIKKLRKNGYSFEAVNLTRDISRRYDIYRIDWIALKKDDYFIAEIKPNIHPERDIRLHYQSDNPKQVSYARKARNLFRKNKIEFSER